MSPIDCSSFGFFAKGCIIDPEDSIMKVLKVKLYLKGTKNATRRSWDMCFLHEFQPVLLGADGTIDSLFNPRNSTRGSSIRGITIARLVLVVSNHLRSTKASEPNN